MSAKVEFDFKELEALSERLVSLGRSSEKVLTETLSGRGLEIVEPHIRKHIPISQQDGTIRNKVHAAYSNWAKGETKNFELTIKPKGGAASNKNSFGYLAFPNLGVGKHNRVAQNFMEIGRDESLPALVSELQANLIKHIQEEL